MKVFLLATPVFLLLAGITLPSTLVRTRCSEPSCINTLRQIEGAKEQCALESQLSMGAIVTEEQVREYLKGGVIPECPKDGRIAIGAVGQPPTCSLGKSQHHRLPGR